VWGEGERESWLVVMKSISMNPRYLASYLALYFLFFMYRFSRICGVVFRVWRLNDRLVDGFVSFCNFFSGFVLFGSRKLEFREFEFRLGLLARV
jgi:hypothetical protein